MVHFHFNKSILSEAEITTYSNQSATTQVSPVGILNSLQFEKWAWKSSKIWFSFSHTEKEMLSMQYNTPIFFTKTCTCHFSRNSGGRILYSLQIWLFFLIMNKFFFFFFLWLKNLVNEIMYISNQKKSKAKKPETPALQQNHVPSFTFAMCFLKPLLVQI